MQRVIIEMGKGKRLIVYKEGGCHAEAYVKGIGWVIDNEACDGLKALDEAIDALARCRENVRLAA